MILPISKNHPLLAKFNLKIRPEIELLLCSICPEINSDTDDKIKSLLQHNLDWNYLYQKAEQHEVFLLFYQNFKNNYHKLIPPDILQKFHLSAQARIARNLFLTKELWQILDLFELHNITVIPFKGPIYSVLAYKGLGKREFCDLDIFVRKDNFLKAKNLLIENGYKHKQTAEHEATCGQAQMMRNDGLVGVDLHYEIAPSNLFKLDAKEFWQRVEPITIGGESVLSFSKEDSLFISYLQGIKENWISLKRLCDTVSLMQDCSLNECEKVWHRLEALGYDRICFFSMVLSQVYLGISWPEKFNRKLVFLFPKLEKLLKKHYDIAFQEEWQTNRILFQNLIIHQILVGDSFWSKVQGYWKMAFNLNYHDFAIVTLPKFLYFLYYPLRLWRLIKTYKIGKNQILLLGKNLID